MLVHLWQTLVSNFMWFYQEGGIGWPGAPLFNFLESLTQDGSVFLTSLAAFTSEVASA